jgi:anthranilate synthase component 1
VTAEPDEIWDAANRRLDDIVGQLRTSMPLEPLTPPQPVAVEPGFRTTKQDFLTTIQSAKSFIRDGDVFQVVITQRFDTSTTASSVDVYRMLRALNPSPYMYLLSLETRSHKSFAIVGSSPEALVKVNEGRVFSHPIAGSRPRGDTPERDGQLADDLLADQKERAEHLMLVDLARNDLSRVCVPGSVAVTEFMNVERFSHIMHLVSSVEGDVSPGITPIDVFRATFPAGTLSGAPKPRALEIIDQLEPAGRGVYGGVVGYIGFGGDSDLAIAIRTAVLADGRATVQAGAGIVADSDPESEYNETVAKAAAPLRAIAAANALSSALESNRGGAQ